MILNISTTHQPATDLSWLLHKHPSKLQSFPISGGKAHVFYPENTDKKCTATLLLDLNNIDLVRKLKTPRGSSLDLQSYVNDRPYTASSFMSTAIAKVFSSALNGKCNDRPELLNQAWDFDITIGALRVAGGMENLERIFKPLGYEIAVEGIPYDSTFLDWGDSPYYIVHLKNHCTLQELLSHLYILLAVYDKDRHYWISDSEIDKLFDKGGNWLQTHPERAFIIRRFLKNLGPLTKKALERFTLNEENSQENKAMVKTEKSPLHKQRLETVTELLKQSGAKTVVDLGCGEGKLLKMLLPEPQFDHILGMDVSMRSLRIAKEKLYLDNMTPNQRKRIDLLQSSLTYRDERLTGFDAAALVEVIEHLEPESLHSLELAVFKYAKPKTVIITTPNKEYNRLYEFLEKGKMRHGDHRFEWTRKEFQEWANKVASAYNYQVSFGGIGEEDETFGTPSQLAVFSFSEPLRN